MTIPFVDLVSQFETIQSEVLPAVQGVMRNAQFILGEEVALFEREFAKYCESDPATK